MVVSDTLYKDAQTYSGSDIICHIYGTASKMRREDRWESSLVNCQKDYSDRVVGKSDFSVFFFFFLICFLFLQANFNSKPAVIILFLNQVQLQGEGGQGNQNRKLRGGVPPAGAQFRRSSGGRQGQLPPAPHRTRVSKRIKKTPIFAKHCFMLPSYLAAQT